MRLGGYALLCWWALMQAAFALSADTPLPDPAQEARARALFQELRCVTCQSEAIADSRAQVAQDMRMSVRGQVAAGESDAAILDYMVAHYGDFVLMRPPVERHPLLWFGPLVILLGGIFIAWSYFRRASHPRDKHPAP